MATSSPVSPVAPSVLSDGAGMPPPQSLVERLERFFRQANRALAKRTLDALHSDGRLFADWCHSRSVPWLPAEPGTVAAFVEEIGATRKPATVTRYLASIAMWHAAAEQPNPCATLDVKLARKAHAKEKGLRQRQAKPVGEAEIAAIVDAIAPVDPAAAPDLVALRDTALLLTARDSLARASELVGMRWDDLESAEDGDGAILIRRSKTDQAGEGRIAWLAADTMQALATWRAALATAVDPATKTVVEPSPLLFRHLSRRGYDRPALTTTSVARIIKRRAADIGLILPGYSAHSTRVGAVQDLLAAGEDLLGVMNAGAWKSPRMPAHYGERLLASRGAVARLRKRTKAP